MPFLDGKVKDKVQVTYGFHMLPYHHGIWEVSLLLPYIEDLCHSDSKYCDLYLDYAWFCLINRNWVMYDISRSIDNLIQTWTATVASRFFLDKEELRTLFSSRTDTHNSEMRTRTMYKYAAHKGVSGTPYYFVNEVKVVDYPKTADDWLKLLQKVYDSQKQHLV